MSFAAGFAAGLGAGKKLFGGGSGGGEDTDEWNPPASWIPVPEPGPYDIYLLVQIPEGGTTFYIDLRRPSDAQIGWGNLSVDFGDGTVLSATGIHYDPSFDDWTREINGRPPLIQHTYTEAGQYLIHYTTSEDNCGFISVSPRNLDSIILIMKLGSNIVLNDQEIYNYGQYIINNQRLLKYFKYNGAGKLPNHGFSGSCALRKIEIVTPINDETLASCAVYGNSYYFQRCYGVTSIDLSQVKIFPFGDLSFSGIKKAELPICEKIGQQGFMDCRSLLEVNAPVCEEISQSAFEGCYQLRKVYLPNCTSVGDYAFRECYNLEEIVLAEGCVIGSNAFRHCCSLINAPT